MQATQFPAVLIRLPPSYTVAEALDVASKYGGKCVLERGLDGSIRGVVVVCAKGEAARP
jgi:hypothetical protein